MDTIDTIVTSLNSETTLRRMEGGACFTLQRIYNTEKHSIAVSQSKPMVDFFSIFLCLCETFVARHCMIVYVYMAKVECGYYIKCVN